MEGRIYHLHHHYRIFGASNSPGVVAGRLDRLAQERLPEALSATLSQALGDDEAVYILRQVHIRMALQLTDSVTEGKLTGRWAKGLTGAVIHHIAHTPDDGRNLIRFANQADYVAHWISDLLRGRAAQCWFYYPFAWEATESVASALCRVLLENRAHLPAILGYLHQYGTLEALLPALDDSTLQELWSHGLGADDGGQPASLRPLFADALRLVDILDWWKRSPPAETLFEGYLASGPPPADWRDPRGLAGAILAVLRFLTDQGYLRKPGEAQEHVLLARLDRVLGEFDWLDTDALRKGVIDLLLGRGPQPPPFPFPAIRHTVTPRQRELLSDLAGALTGEQVDLEYEQPGALANALRLYARLVAHAPRWADDGLATATIQRLLSACHWLARSRQPGEALRHLSRGNVPAALHTLDQQDRGHAARALRLLSDLGEPGLRAARILVGDVPQVPVVSAGGTRTACAGVFLLLRAILDARLPWLASEAKCPLSALIAALGLRWAGPDALDDDRLDPALGTLAGLDSSPTLAEMREGWSTVGSAQHADLQAALLQVLAGQRMLGGSVLHLHRLALADGQAALVAGDGTAQLWPLGRVAGNADDVTELLGAWLSLWQATTGQQPTVASDAEVDLPGLVPVPADPAAGEDPSASGHRTGRAALSTAMQALDHGRLGLLQVDLTVGLAASALLRLWARWLPQFAQASVPYLLSEFIHRPGWMSRRPDGLLIEVESRPLDIVLEMSGYLAELERVPWLGNQNIRFQRRE